MIQRFGGCFQSLRNMRKAYPYLLKHLAVRPFSRPPRSIQKALKQLPCGYPPNTQPDEAALMALIQQGVEGSKQPALASILEQLSGHHPQEPHWHLAMIGTDPICQGQGYGSALLAHTLAICDQQRNLVYLEATNARNVALYQKHGFEVLGTVQAENSPTLYPMLRHPQ